MVQTCARLGFVANEVLHGMLGLLALNVALARGRKAAQSGCRAPARPHIIGSASGSAIAPRWNDQLAFVMLVHLPHGHSAENVRDDLLATIKTLPDHLRRSLTWDQGTTEMARYKEVTVASDMAIYFCDPHSPSQCGSNENTKGLLRQYFPKGTNLNIHSPERLLEVATELNQRPRKTLEGITPAAALQKVFSTPPNPTVATTT